MTMNQKETPEEYRDRQIKRLTSENITLQADKKNIENRLIHVKNFQREVISLRDNDEATLKAKLKKAESDLNIQKIINAILIAALIVSIIFFKLANINEEERSRSLQEDLANKTWEYRPQNHQLKQADRFLSGDVLMFPGDTAIFALPKSQFKLLVIKK